MYPRNTERINTEYASVAIVQAVRDVERIEKLEQETGQWKVEMSQWHGATVDSDPDAPVCGVCMGGAMLARVHGYTHGERSPVSDLVGAEREVVSAMDDVREPHQDAVHEGLMRLGVSPIVAGQAIQSVVGGDCFTTYEQGPDIFKRERLALATELARMGY